MHAKLKETDQLELHAEVKETDQYELHAEVKETGQRKLCANATRQIPHQSYNATYFHSHIVLQAKTMTLLSDIFKYQKVQPASVLRRLGSQ